MRAGKLYNGCRKIEPLFMSLTAGLLKNFALAMTDESLGE